MFQVGREWDDAIRLILRFIKSQMPPDGQEQGPLGPRWSEREGSHGAKDSEAKAGACKKEKVSEQRGEKVIYTRATRARGSAGGNTLHTTQHTPHVNTLCGCNRTLFLFAVYGSLLPVVILE